MRRMSGLDCRFQEVEEQEQEAKQQHPPSVLSPTIVSGSLLQPPTGYPVCPQKRPRGRPRKVVPSTSDSVGGDAVERNTNQEAALGFAGGIGVTQKRPRGRPRKVAPTAGASAGGAPVGGNAVQRNTNQDAALGFAGGIGVAHGSVISDSGQARYESQQVPASLRETRVSHGNQVKGDEQRIWINSFGVAQGSVISDSGKATYKSQQVSASLRETSVSHGNQFKGDEQRIRINSFGVALGSVISDSGKATYESQQVPASLRETRMSQGDQSKEYEQMISIDKANAQAANSTKQKRHRGVRKRPGDKWTAEIRDPSKDAKVYLGTFDSQEEAARAYDEAAWRFRNSQEKVNLPVEVHQRDGNAHQHLPTSARESQHFGAVGHSDPITDSPYDISLISQYFPGFHLYVDLLKNPGLSSLPRIQQYLAMSLPNPSLQQPTSSNVLSWPTESLPAVSATALQHHIPIEPSSQYYSPNITEKLQGIGNGFESQLLYSNVPESRAVSASALQRPTPTEPSSQYYSPDLTEIFQGIGGGFESQLLYSNVPGSGAVSASDLQHPIPTEPSFQYYSPDLTETFQAMGGGFESQLLYSNVPESGAVSASALEHPIPTDPSSQYYSPDLTELLEGMDIDFELQFLYPNVPGAQQ